MSRFVTHSKVHWILCVHCIMKVPHRPSSGSALTQRKHFSAPGAENKAPVCSCFRTRLSQLVHSEEIHMCLPHLLGYLGLCQGAHSGFLTHQPFRNHGARTVDTDVVPLPVTFPLGPCPFLTQQVHLPRPLHCCFLVDLGWWVSRCPPEPSLPTRPLWDQLWCTLIAGFSPNSLSSSLSTCKRSRPAASSSCESFEPQCSPWLLIILGTVS